MPKFAWLATMAAHPLIRKAVDSGYTRLAHHRVRQLDRLDVVQVQEQTLFRLLHRARWTQFGQAHDFSTLRTVADYQQRVPIRDYEAFWTGYWRSQYPRLDNVTWPGKIPYYALSSGTTSGTTKYLPISWEMIRSNRRAAFTTMALFRHRFPRAEIFRGKFFFLGGSTDLRQQIDGSLAGDLSGIAAKEFPDSLREYVFPPLELGLISDWEIKLQRLAELSIREPITAISGVPSWLLILFDRVKQLTGKRTIAEIWPMLQLVVHGGTSFEGYRETFRRELGNDQIQFCEVYPCSEGFIATEDPRYRLLRLVPDHDLFFEFVPVAELDHDRPTRHTLRTLEIGVHYAILVTSCAGLWSYSLGDTIVFERKNPPLLRFTGRTKFFLSAFGEHLILEEVESAVTAAAHAHGVEWVDFHVGPIFPDRPSQPGRHRYLIEFRREIPTDLDAFARSIDHELCRLNEDYAAHRVGDLTMLLPEIWIVPPGGYDAWMRSRGKHGGQFKVPRMDNTGKITQDLSAWLESFRSSCSQES